MLDARDLWPRRMKLVKVWGKCNSFYVASVALLQLYRLLYCLFRV